MRGLTYKVLVEVNGVKTQALLDPGAQVTLVRKELLPMIKEKNNWSDSQCNTRNIKMDGQPIGAGGETLGAVVVVALYIAIKKIKETRQVSCYVLESTKPIWEGKLRNCAVILGANSLDSLGFRIVYLDGTAVQPGGQGSDSKEEEKFTVEVLAISVSNTIHIGPQQTVLLM